MAPAGDDEWKKDSAELLMLSLFEDQPRHGYEIGRLIDIRSGGTLHFHLASLYPLLPAICQRAVQVESIRSSLCGACESEHCTAHSIFPRLVAVKGHTCKQKNSAPRSTTNREVGSPPEGSGCGTLDRRHCHLLQLVAGAKGYPKVPPGILILVAV